MVSEMLGGRNKVAVGEPMAGLNLDSGKAAQGCKPGATVLEMDCHSPIHKGKRRSGGP